MSNHISFVAFLVFSLSTDMSLLKCLLGLPTLHSIIQSDFFLHGTCSISC
uniref:Uncharacterized protein n=1 Tax=Rhizophora mucronata TaxID=61149 RepID=A0A2P2Q7N0_RHIMU